MNLPVAARFFAGALLTAAKNFWLHNRFNDCAAVSYYALLSIVPLGGLATVIVSQFLGANSHDILQLLERGGLLAPEFVPQLEGAITEMVEHRFSIGVVSLLVTIWFSSLVFSSIQTAFDRIFHTLHPPIWGTIKPRLAALVAASFLILGFFFSTANAFLRSIDSAGAARLISLIDRLPYTALLSSFVIDLTIFTVILYSQPMQLRSWRMVVPSALFGVLSWRAARSLVGIYLGYASSSFSFTGSAGAALIFMLWVYYATCVLLLSAELLAVLDGGPTDPVSA